MKTLDMCKFYPKKDPFYVKKILLLFILNKLYRSKIVGMYFKSIIMMVSPGKNIIFK